MIRAKICGLTTAEAAEVAASEGATDLGFVHFLKSPRHLTLEAATELEASLPAGPRRVGVMVDPTSDEAAAFARALKLDAIQLHGSESASVAAELKTQTGLQIFKAIPVAEAADLQAAEPFAGVAHALLFDAKPPKGADLPGGNAHSFPWHLMQSFKTEIPWYLAGGLTPENVSEAISQASAPGVDVSSGVEDGPGKKSLSKIKAFLRAVHGAK